MKLRTFEIEGILFSTKNSQMFFEGGLWKTNKWERRLLGTYST